ncbi:hypothetical protein ACEWY4_021046 [Coilia grayii]|uniref:ZBR-type domain-containing protein n=1 Tax=Coilia grayii TaxID=363190 RepID=A0ABD1J7V6_9TELE
MTSLRGKRKRPASCEKNTEMKCPAESLVSCCTEQRVTEAVDEPDCKRNVKQSSPQKKSVRVSLKTLPSPVVSSVTFYFDTVVKGKENKDCPTLEPLANTLPDETDRGDELLEDSGYLSHQNSQYEHRNVDCTEHLGGLFEESVSPVCSGKSTPDTAVLPPSTLPILRFQQEVCLKLSETFKKTQHYDWSVINKLANSGGLQNVIGGKMGLECVDILSALLEKNMKHILTRILSRLEDTDLISCEKVCKTWRTIICQENSAFKRCREAQQRIKEPKPTGSYSRDFAPSRVVFSFVQPVTSTPVSTPSRVAFLKKDTPQHQATSKKTSRFHRFLEAASTLKQDEGLRRCRQCSSPARYDSAMKRAVCTRASCTYDFCTLCLGAFHGSEPCRTGVLGSFSSESRRTPLPCSKQSKRNIRRL